MAKVRVNPGQKWARVTPQRTEDYVQGVQNPRTSWAAATSGAEKNYEAGIQEAITKKRFGKGVQKAGDQKWQAGAAGIGASRYGQGVQNAEGAYTAGFAPYESVINSVQLPPRYPKGDPRNLERVKVMAAALRAKKVAG